ncbi:MAG: glycosyltransferase family 4 protein [Candidatus Sumerlaeia bacterium]|nr:glycosyltransferase family 4 protein [Candidatus Sumerlaeia bacterium]
MKIAVLAPAHKIHANRWCRFLSQAGHEVVLFSDTDIPPHLDYGTVRRVAPNWTFLRKLVVFKLRGGEYANNTHKWRAYIDLIRAENPDVIHAHEALSYGPMLAHMPPDIPRALTPWGPDIESLKGENREVRELVKRALRAADVITTNAPGLEAHWSTLTGAPREKFRLFSWGVNPGEFRPAGDSAVDMISGELDLPGDARVLLSPRLARAYCRIDMILRGWKLASEELPGNTILLVLRAGAKGEDWENLKTLARDEGIDRVRFVERNMSPAEMAALYTRCDGTVMAPLTDLVAMSLLESMACGSIPILVGHPCYRETVADLREKPHMQGHGIFAPEPTPEGLADAFRRWGMLSLEQREKTALFNNDYISNHQDWNLNARKMLDVYQAALDMKAGRIS